MCLLLDGHLLWEAIRGLPKVNILTGLPYGRWAAPQKRQWCLENLGTVPVITCMARDKYKACKVEGSILIDDNLSAEDAWVKSGGIFVHHVSAEKTILELKRLRVLDV